MGEDRDGSFGARLRLQREAAGLSQEELAERAGISSHAVSALERGTRTRPYPHTVRALADALAASPEDRADLISAVPARRTARSGGSGSGSGSRPADTEGASGPGPAGARPLPAPGTPLHGRDEQVARVAALVRERRLVTLTGTGGVGKTRLALAVAERAGAHFAGGVVLVELGPLPDVDAVLPAVADAVGAAPEPGRPLADAVVDRLHGQQLLLVLDNFEHLLDAAVEVARLVEAVPHVAVLVTSRAPLRVRGETEVPVEPLSPGPAADLLLERARAVSGGWGAAPGETDAVTAVCERLAGIPLALELAAARARLLDPAALLDRLDDAVTAGPRDLPARQRTMRATLDWSYGLLTPGEQHLLRLLSAFVGGFRLEDLEGVARRAGVDDVLPALEALAAHSLVLRDPGVARPVRHRLLEPVAQYARARLEEAGETDGVHAAHLDHYLALAEEAAPRFQDGEQVAWLRRIDAEHANLVAAAERGLESGRATEVGRLSWSLWMYWWVRGHHAQGRRLAQAALGRPLPDEVTPRVELAAATMSFAMDDIPASRHWWERALVHARAGDDLVAQANSVAGVGLAVLATGDAAGAREHFRQAGPLAEAAGPEGEWTAALNQVWSGTVELVLGDADAAVAHIERGLASARRRGDRLTAYVGLFNLAQLELSRGRHGDARDHLEAGMRLSLQTGDHSNLAYFLEATGVLEAAEGRHSRVPLLLGAVQGIRETVGARGYFFYRPDPEAIGVAEGDARRHLGGDRFDDALDVGRRLTPEEAVELALGERPSP